jgi:hypothetical protein
MDEISALNSSTGTAIPDILPPTFKIFAAHLVKNKDAILAITSSTVSYGDHPRQTMDIYKGSSSDTSPILVFLHGGGLIRGDKISPQVPHGLVYHNVGSYFSSKGITTIIPNYRRVNSGIGGEDAVYPSGGEDISLILKWLEKYSPGNKRDVYLLGNSAGGIHASTFLLDPIFLEQRKSYQSGEKSIILKGVIEMSVACHFESAAARRSEVLKKYYGDAAAIKAHCVYGLLEAISKAGKSREEVAVPKVLALLGEYDPTDEIGEPMLDFSALWKKTWGDDGITFDTMEGHNHVSPPLSLLSGDAKGEKWGEDVVEWIKG